MVNGYEGAHRAWAGCCWVASCVARNHTVRLNARACADRAAQLMRDTMLYDSVVLGLSRMASSLTRSHEETCRGMQQRRAAGIVVNACAYARTAKSGGGD